MQEKIKSAKDVPCDWCGVTYALNSNRRQSPQKLLPLVHRRTGEARKMWLCWTCRNRPGRTVWLAWKRGDDATRDAARDAVAPFGIREVRRRHRRAQAFEQRRAASRARAEAIVAAADHAVLRARRDAGRVAAFERRRAMARSEA
jgi:hypothetical protein